VIKSEEAAAGQRDTDRGSDQAEILSVREQAAGGRLTEG
jgi:hypothetical protein